MSTKFCSAACKQRFLYFGKRWDIVYAGGRYTFFFLKRDGMKPETKPNSQSPARLIWHYSNTASVYRATAVWCLVISDYCLLFFGLFFQHLFMRNQAVLVSSGAGGVTTTVWSFSEQLNNSETTAVFMCECIRYLKWMVTLICSQACVSQKYLYLYLHLLSDILSCVCQL